MVYKVDTGKHTLHLLEALSVYPTNLDVFLPKFKQALVERVGDLKLVIVMIISPGA